MTETDKPVVEYESKPTKAPPLIWLGRAQEWVDLNERVIFAIGCGILAYGIGRCIGSNYRDLGPNAMMWGGFIIGLFITPRRFRKS